MRVVVEPSVEAAAEAAAARIAAALAAAIATRGRATLALSGGNSAGPLLESLARQRLDWDRVEVFQVDERIAPEGDPGRNLTALKRALVESGPLPAARLHAMPVTAIDLAASAAAYASQLRIHAGDPPALDVVHLGMGEDGHTASLFPGDAAAVAMDRAVALTGAHAGYRRMTLTLPVLNAARQVAWLVTGPGKHAVLSRLVAGDLDAPAGRVAREGAVVFADAAASG
jgi:6-phosphogluconolactonase